MSEERCAFCGRKLQYKKSANENVCVNVQCKQLWRYDWHLHPERKEKKIADETVMIEIRKGSRGNELVIVKFNESRHFNPKTMEWCPTINELNHITYWMNRLMEERGEKTWTRFTK